MAGGVVALTGGPTAMAAAQSQTFSYTGASESFQVPAGVTAIQVDAYGAEGGAGDDGAIPGLGGRATSVVCVTPGETLQVYVGGQGESLETVDAGLEEPEAADAPGTDGVGAQAVGAAGGFNGGGDALEGDDNTGGGGGGASDVRRGTALDARLVVAGGGGGGGGDANVDDPWSQGGAGGGLTGVDGQDALSDAVPTPGGKGASQTAGGAADTTFDPTATSGTLGQGGTGGAGLDENDGGGGGGGGLYGGGGGAGDDNETDDGGGGGGGSGFGPAGVAFETGVQAGDGLVTISWDPDEVSAVCLAPRFTG